MAKDVEFSVVIKYEISKSSSFISSLLRNLLAIVMNCKVNYTWFYLLYKNVASCAEYAASFIYFFSGIYVT
jgi:hypothetical protein